MKKNVKKYKEPAGSALILVVVVTVLLAVVGVMFLMVSRASELETGAVVQSADLDNAVDSVVAKINEVLVEDLFGNDNQMVDSDSGASDEPYDAARADADSWLASLEPKWYGDNGTPANPSDDIYAWPRITDLYSNNFGIAGSYYDPQNDSNPVQWDGSMLDFRVDATDTLAKVIASKDRMKVIAQQSPAAVTDWDDPAKLFPGGARADADGDGVADSRWVQVPGLTTSRGEPIYAAIRIIDNCAMLNLNGAHCFYQDSYATGISPFMTPWYATEPDMVGTIPYHDNQSGSGRYLTEINYMPFLRGHDLNGNFFDGGATGDDWYNIMLARGMFDSVAGLPYLPRNCNAILNLIESPIAGYQFFDVSDELELRNRYLVTSKTEARFERPDIANFTLDAGGGTYGSLETPVDDPAAFNAWKIKNESANFDIWDGGPEPYRYDRRHVCTVYSYDRMFRRGDYTLLDGEFATLTSGPVWATQRIELARKVFWPVGPVTTDINVPVYVETSPGSGVWKWQDNRNNTETRRRILHLLFAFREYFNQQDPLTAAKRAAQVVANLIDYSDDDAPNSQIPGETEGPFYHPDYGQQANVNSTFITEDIIRKMVEEVSGGLLPVGSYDFGLTETVFGYEIQPFISDVFVRWDGGAIPPNPHLIGFAIELINPYDFSIDIKDWKLKIGPAIDHAFGPGTGRPPTNVTIIPAYSNATGPGRLVIQINSTGSVPGGAIGYNITNVDWGALENDIQSQSVVLIKPETNSPTGFLNVDSVPNTDLKEIVGYSNPLGGPGNNALKRDDNDWRFVQAQYDIQRESDANFTDTLGRSNNLPDGTINTEGFQIGVADDGLPLCRWHELEILGLYGNGPDDDPNAVMTREIADAAAASRHFNLAGSSSDLLDYIATINRPDLGSLPGRININTAPVHVIAAAIPPTLADPNAADPAETVTFSALQLAQEIVNHRPYQKLSQLLTKVPEFKQYDDSGTGPWTGENVGTQSIEDDIEEEHWVLSNLANKFTVRSDTFTAYMLVRLGAEGPQRRMIAVFDRSGVWEPNDPPKLVALHPVPDPR